MTTNPSATDTNLGMVRAALAHMSLQEVESLLRAIDTHSSAGNDTGHADASVWFHVTAAVVNKCVRSRKIASNSVEQARSQAYTAAIREELVGQRRRLLDESGPGAVLGLPAIAPVLEATTDIDAAIRRVYELVLQRTPKKAEVDIWRSNLAQGIPFNQFLLLVDRGEEANRVRSAANVTDITDAEFVQSVYEIVLGRCAHPRDINAWVQRLSRREITRQGVLMAMFNAGKAEDESLSSGHDGLSCLVMGTTNLVHVNDWMSRAQLLEDVTPEHATKKEGFTKFYIKTKPRFLVTAIASLYRGADFIEQFMDNITSQTIFDEYCELIIVDADSPENESSVIERYMAKHKGIQYLRMNYRIGIYDAWNVGVKAARGDYLTNTNLDDLRRRDSLELQASVLDNLDFVDVTYQDFYYSFDPGLTPEQVAAFGYKSNLPVVTPYNMITYNSPHNAPMWRKRLHDELGMFDTSYKSAGDYEFWMRCLAANKTFFKLNEPHVIYYQNPHGLSTRADTRGVVEGRDVHRRYSRPLISQNITSELKEFGANALGLTAAHAQMLQGDISDRYAFVQAELRHLARTTKFGTGGML
jgi:glycosyltransferase involved in cell wall biosynthesis